VSASRGGCHDFDILAITVTVVVALTRKTILKLTRLVVAPDFYGFKKVNGGMSKMCVG